MMNLAFQKLSGGVLCSYKGFGKPTLVVNTASACGYTPQYAALQKLHEAYGPRGLVVVGVPCNDFGEQEPGSAAEIGTFCTAHFGVTFPMAEKVSITSVPRHPFYESIQEAAGEDALPRWNFHKYLISRTGELIGSWPSKISPLSKEITEAIEAAL